MKHLRTMAIIMMAVLMVLPVWVLAEEEGTSSKDTFEQNTLFKSGKVTHGGFGAPIVKISTIKNRGRVLVGGRGAWLINHKWTIGGGGYGVASDMTGNVSGTNRRFHMGYGGFEIGYICKPASLFHMRFINLIGAGGIGYSRNKDDDCDCDWDFHDRYRADSFFVLEPSLSLELNIVKWMRMSLGAGYRYVNGVDNVPDFKSEDLSGPSIELNLTFGKF
ncbi:MAG: hypothetical protein JW827_06435 [Spirochaetes bacterium]|nr:hypothetical protein [Spirochaetota bacterium]